MKHILNKLIATAVLISSSLAAELKPNIIVILTDDQGYQDLGCYGSPDIKTPHIDKMASEGMRFTDFYVAASVCSPSRASLLTGLYPQRVGVNRVFFPNQESAGLNPKHVTIAEVLKTVGYHTKAVGKWHLGDEEQFLPTNQGFDSYYGIPYSNDMYPAKKMKYAEDCLWREGMGLQKIAEAFKVTNKMGNPSSLKDRVPLMRNEECIEFPVDQTTITQRYTDEAIQFIQEKSAKKEPFFLYLSHSMPHTPLYASSDFKGRSERGLYGDVIEEIDFNVGRLLSELEKQNINKNTIVVYTSDNGPWLIKKEDGGSALPLFEGKMSTFEGGQRVPSIIKWPAKIPAGSVCKELVTAMDLLPTFARISGATLAENPIVDGKDIFEILKNTTGAISPHKYFFYKVAAVRSGDWKYHLNERFVVKGTARKSTGPTLYNLKDDIGESVNLIKENPEIAERLRKALDHHRASLKSM